MRAVVIALLVVLACTVSVSAASSEWAAPEALWESDLSASELEARHSEFLMATDASSTGAANFSSSSSSSTGVAGEAVAITAVPVAIKLNCVAGNSTDRGCGAINVPALTQGIGDAFDFPRADLPGEALFINLTSTVLPDTSSSSSSTGAPADSSSSGAAGSSSAQSSSTGVAAPVLRRLLAAQEGTEAKFNFVGSSVDQGVHAKNAYAALVASLSCTATETQSVAQCQNAAAQKYGFTKSLSASPAFQQLAAVTVPKTLAADAAVVDDANNRLSGDRNVASVGGPRRTNIGYYVLGAILLAFILAALIYFIVHKRPTTTIVKEEPLRRDEVALAPVVAAPAAANSGVVVAEEQPLAAGAQQQMDYRSVFALKHNVLDKSAEQKAAEEDEHNHNDVHFILHQ